MMSKFKPFEATDKIEFKDPDTGFMYHAASRAALYSLIVTYREQNNLEPLEGLNYVVENYLCSLPENCHKCQENEKLERSFLQYMKGGVVLLKNMLWRQFAPQDVAEIRAAQCETCPFNVFIDKGPFLKWTDDIASSQIGDRRTANHEKLGSCEVCTCVIKSKVFHYGSLPKFSDAEVEKFKTVNCWQLPLSGQA